MVINYYSLPDMLLHSTAAQVLTVSLLYGGHIDCMADVFKVIENVIFWRPYNQPWYSC